VWCVLFGVHWVTVSGVVDQERIDVCKQEVIVVETNTCFKYNNTQIISSLYQQQYFVFRIKF